MASGASTLHERYTLFGEIASGGMAAVHIGRLVGPVGFARTVAIKRLHPQFAKDPEFVSMFLDEARLAARIRHPNVVQTLDVVASDGEVFLVMDYVQGETLSRIARHIKSTGTGVPLPVANAIATAALQGLHAAHEAMTDRGQPLAIVHRDVSPQNIIVGTDGVTRVLDFGVAKASWRAQTTRDGHIKGKLSYMAPEQLASQEIDRRADVYGLGVVLWEALTGRRLIQGDDLGSLTTQILRGEHPPPSHYVPSIPPVIDEIVLRALARTKEERFDTARAMCIALEKAAPCATAREVGEWLESIAGDALRERAASIAEIESASSSLSTRPPAALGPADVAARGEVVVAPSSSGAAQPPELGTVPGTAVSTQSSLQLSAAGVPRRLRGRTVAITAAVAVVVLGGGALALLGLRSPHSRGPSAAASSPQASTSAIASVPPPAPPPPLSGAVPSSTESAASTPKSTATASAPPPPSSPVVRPTATARPTQSPASTKPPKNNACDPPYTIDAKGIKIPKAQCF